MTPGRFAERLTMCSAGCFAYQARRRRGRFYPGNGEETVAELLSFQQGPSFGAVAAA